MAEDKAARKALQKALQLEAAKAMELWGSEIKVGKAKKKDPTFPFPIYVRRTVSQPDDACEFDIGEINVRLVVNGLDLEEDPPSVKVTDKLPAVMVKAMEKRVLGEWLAALQSGEPGSWHIVEMLQWCKDNFRLLCGVADQCLDPYMGTSFDGATQRRYAVIEPRQEERKMSQAEKAKAAEDEEAELEAAREYWATRRAERAEKEAERAAIEGAKKKQMADEGVLEKGPVKLSKKQLLAAAEEKRAMKGRRTAKTASRRKKFVPEDK